MKRTLILTTALVLGLTACASTSPEDAKAAYLDYAKSHASYQGESDARLAEQAEFGCDLILAIGSYDEFVALGEANSPGGKLSAEDLEGGRLMVEGYCPEAL